MKFLNLGQDKITEEFLRTEDGESISINKYHFTFNVWTKPNSYDTYGGKSILELNNEPLFPELLILRLLEQEGYKGVWVDTYRNKFWQRLPQFSFPVIIDNKLQQVIDSIYEAKDGRKSGCFDVIAYKDEHFIFIELKKKKEDQIRDSQIEWLKAALKIGFKRDDFIIAEWEISNKK